MRIAVIGAGFTGLSAALELIRAGQQVTIFEKSDVVGGQVRGWKRNNWEWAADCFYHHIFTNDDTAISLANELGISPAFSRPQTNILWNGKKYPLDSPLGLLQFPGLSFAGKLRMGAVLAAFKLLPNGQFLDRWSAPRGMELLLGKKGYEALWKPLLEGKFGKHTPNVNLAWFWARIKKRTARLGTFPGGFQVFAEKIAEEIKRLGGVIHLNNSVIVSARHPERSKAESKDLAKRYKISESGGNLLDDFDAVLSTLPDALPAKNNIPYLSAHVVLLELKHQFFADGTYWLNILDKGYPFLVVAEHTNFVDKSHFGGSNLLYIGNYCPNDAPLLSYSKKEILKKFIPYLKKINKSFSEKEVINTSIFKGSYAQPVMPVGYSKQIPSIRQHGKFYVANQSMIYPWDRGINYAIELGQKAAREIMRE